MYLPALIGADIAADETRFLIAILSVSQPMHMSEVGTLLLRADPGVSLRHLVAILAIRTMIAATIAVLLARLLF